MILLPPLTGILRSAVEELGLPLPLATEDGQHVYMLLECNTAYEPGSGYTASIPGIRAIGGGDTREEAALALREALLKYIDAFGDET